MANSPRSGARTLRVVIALALGSLGFGVALLALGGVLMAQGNDLAGLACDALGVVILWSAFHGYRRR